MSAASKYWTFIRLDAHRGCRSQEIPSAKAFVLEQFPEFASGQAVSELLIQRQLLHWYRGESSAGESLKRTLGEFCLRCFISKQIEQTCIQLELKFGNEHGFTRYDLFPFVLTDAIRESQLNSPQDSVPNPTASTYKTLAAEILQSFSPERGSLAGWTTRLVKQQRELKAFLLERGVYLVSDWAILNDTTPEQLSRILKEFHQRTLGEIQQASILLESYHAVYRRDRLAAPATGMRGQCPLPTTEQLQQIAHHFHLKTNLMLLPQEVMERLQKLAESLRQYRISVRVGTLPTESLDDPNVNRSYQLASHSSASDPFEDVQAEFLTFYQQQFINYLDQALEEVIGDRLTYLQRKKSNKSKQFTTALCLFHCQGQSMGEIASQIGLQAQYQVSRLLQLKALRADVRQKMLKSLLDCILEQATTYIDSERLLTLNQQAIEMALDEEIAKIIQEAEVETEVNNNRNSPLSSLFAQRLCRCLRTQR